MIITFQKYSAAKFILYYEDQAFSRYKPRTTTAFGNLLLRTRYLATCSVYCFERNASVVNIGLQMTTDSSTLTAPSVVRKLKVQNRYEIVLVIYLSLSCPQESKHISYINTTEVFSHRKYQLEFIDWFFIQQRYQKDEFNPIVTAHALSFPAWLEWRWLSQSLILSLVIRKSHLLRGLD